MDAHWGDFFDASKNGDIVDLLERKFGNMSSSIVQLLWVNDFERHCCKSCWHLFLKECSELQLLPFLSRLINIPWSHPTTY